MLVVWKYIPRNSLIESFDPRARWFTSFLLMFAIIQYWNFNFLIVFLLISITQLLLTKLTWKELRRPLIFMFVLVVVIIGLNAMLSGRGGPGDVQAMTPHYYWQKPIRIPVFGWTLNLSITAEKAFFAITQMTRMFSIALMFIIIPYTMNPALYGVTFGGMGIPYRFAFSMDLAFRFVPTLARNFEVTLDAQRARGFELDKIDGGLITLIRKVAPLLIPVTMSAILSGEDIANAMDLRCFGLQQRTWIGELTYRRRDFVLIGSGILILVGSLVIRHLTDLAGFWVPQFMINLAG
ncbi:MAG: energy-coupling factor transporter transmembrane protein EcfT [Anaerolineales bacterium]|nr:energy-coupling factor transporter transmembrane protein EcfT [Anaerolineales bacterium]